MKTSTGRLFSNLVLSWAAIAALQACSGGSNEQKAVKEIKLDTVQTAEISEKLETSISNLPSPVDVVTQLSLSKVSYKHEWLSNPNHATNYYATPTKQALNLGVYMADLGYTCSYFQVQDAVNRLASTKKLSEELSMLNNYETSLMTRFESNLKNRDSLINIVREVYYSADDYLRKNKRADVAAIMLTGAWAEGLYLSTQVNKSFPKSMADSTQHKAHKSIMAQIGYQKKTLPYLISALEKIHSESDLKEIIDKLKIMEGTFAKVEIKDPALNDTLPDITKLSDAGEITDITVLGIANNVAITPEVVAEITKEVEELRELIISK
ncbi:hypothetical protein SAMN05421780_10490 [Flexibacter flexilis DSM 6793]|uniref:Uncharacterized protein n=1 Tax=Flexibacter flexilis DSM 6793 TaxID=927664 RepID=A0A1I1HUY1_9BACT|nr:hypothetical protein [Flexibacter flexilis]SFC27372.1 hypothetical protein SAMN05421780_10490 [Flexibacter flexilis DSM 6793]